jgi:hypothetical protein
VSTGLKTGVNEKNAGTSLPDAHPDWQNDRAIPFDFVQGTASLEMTVAVTKSLLPRDFQ